MRPHYFHELSIFFYKIELLYEIFYSKTLDNRDSEQDLAAKK